MYIYTHIHTTVQKLGDGKSFETSLLCSPILYSFDSKCIIKLIYVIL